MSRLTCGVDIGGTFTDCVLIDEGEGRIGLGKALSSPDDNFRGGFFGSLEVAAEELGLGLEEVLRRAGPMLNHGSTVATNIVVERSGARIGMLTTRGFEDTVRIMRGTGRPTGEPPENLLEMIKVRKPQPLVDRELVRGIDERVDAAGDIVVMLNEEQVAAAVDELVAAGVEAIAVAFAWSVANPDHERRAVEIVRERAPQLFVTMSADITRSVGEYERFVATLMNAYVGPITSRYLSGLQADLEEHGFGGDMHLMQCHGGMVPLRLGSDRPVFTIGSGPVGGLVGCIRLAESLGVGDVIATDMGGTSFDVGIVKDGEPLGAEHTVLGKLRYQVPSLEVVSIGAGGGSIAWIDPHDGGLRVGPRSAASVPGPVCYGRGGTQPTVTDANLVLGYIDPQTRFGTGQGVGRGFTPDLKAAQEAITTVIAEPLGMSLHDAALGIVQIANTGMADLLENQVIGRGFDPRDFVLASYGGAGPLHAAGYAGALGIRTVVVPAQTASVWSAFGISQAQVRFQHEQQAVMLQPFDAAELGKRFAELEGEATAQIDHGAAGAERELRRFAKVQFQWQIHELEIAVPAGPIGDDSVAAISADFLRVYAERYGDSALLPGARLQLTGLRVEAVLPRASSPRTARSASAPASAETRAMWFARGAGPVDAALHRGDAMVPGAVVRGPAVIDLAITSILLPPDTRCERLDTGDFLMTLGTETPDTSGATA